MLPLGAGIALLSVPVFHAAASHLAASNEFLPFTDPMLSVVYSASDDDAQIFVRAAADPPIGRVHIVGPGGTVRLKAKFRDGDRLGQVDVRFETPEPSLEDLMQAYPEGEYRFEGRTAAGERLAGVAELSYELHPECVFEDTATGQVFNGREGAARHYRQWWDAFNLDLSRGKQGSGRWTTDGSYVAEGLYSGHHVGRLFG